MNTLTRIWTTISSPPPLNTAVEVRFIDGTSDYLLWTGDSWFPRHPYRTPIAWRCEPELDDLCSVAS